MRRGTPGPFVQRAAGGSRNSRECADDSFGKRPVRVRSRTAKQHHRHGSGAETAQGRHRRARGFPDRVRWRAPPAPPTTPSPDEHTSSRWWPLAQKALVEVLGQRVEHTSSWHDSVLMIAAGSRQQTATTGEQQRRQRDEQRSGCEHTVLLGARRSRRCEEATPSHRKANTIQVMPMRRPSGSFRVSAALKRAGWAAGPKYPAPGHRRDTPTPPPRDHCRRVARLFDQRQVGCSPPCSQPPTAQHQREVISVACPCRPAHTRGSPINVYRIVPPRRPTARSRTAREHLSNRRRTATLPMAHKRERNQIPARQDSQQRLWRRNEGEVSGSGSAGGGRCRRAAGRRRISSCTTPMITASDTGSKGGRDKRHRQARSNQPLMSKRRPDTRGRNCRATAAEM